MVCGRSCTTNIFVPWLRSPCRRLLCVPCKAKGQIKFSKGVPVPGLHGKATLCCCRSVHMELRAIAKLSIANICFCDVPSRFQTTGVLTADGRRMLLSSMTTVFVLAPGAPLALLGTIRCLMASAALKNYLASELLAKRIRAALDLNAIPLLDRLIMRYPWPLIIRWAYVWHASHDRPDSTVHRIRAENVFARAWCCSIDSPRGQPSVQWRIFSQMMKNSRLSREWLYHCSGLCPRVLIECSLPTAKVIACEVDEDRVCGHVMLVLEGRIISVHRETLSPSL